MAITNAQQYQQLVNKPANGKRPGYRGPGGYQSGQSGPSTGASGNIGGGGAPSPGDTGGEGGYSPSDGSTTQFGGGVDNTGAYDGGAAKKQKEKEKKAEEARKEKAAAEKAAAEKEKRKENTTLFGTVKNFFDKTLLGKTFKTIKDINNLKQRDLFVSSLTDEEREALDEQLGTDVLGDPKGLLNEGVLGTLNDFGYQGGFYGAQNNLGNGNVVGGGGEGGNIASQQQTDPCLGPNPPAYCSVRSNTDDDTDEDTTTGGGLAPRFAGSIFDFTGLADGGIARAGAMDGGRMMMMANQEEEDPEGGIMDLESARDMYFVGGLVKSIKKGVKKATKAVKKIAKSPIGKAALLGAIGFGIPGTSLGGIFGRASFGGAAPGMFGFGGIKNAALLGKTKLFGQAASKAAGPMKYLQRTPFTKGLFGNLGLTTGGGSLMPTLKGGLSLGLGIPFALDALGVGKEEEDGIDLDEYYKTQGIDIDAIRNNPNRILARRFMAEGGDAEPVAKKTMPLLDMDGKEMDLREDGGFVPLGRMERADDVPARLSKNEFVFTADAVRNAGEGDIDKGAEVMYNMMKNLESGGEVSEESQGLDGAREMFKTSQRLEEVL